MNSVGVAAVQLKELKAKAAVAEAKPAAEAASEETMKKTSAKKKSLTDLAGEIERPRAKPAKIPVPPPKAARGKAAARDNARTPASASLGKPGSIGALAREAILAGKSNEEALAAVKRRHPDGKTNLANMNWYRNELRSKGLLPRPK